MDVIGWLIEMACIVAPTIIVIGQL